MQTNILIRPAARGGKYLGHDAADAYLKSAFVALIDAQTDRLVASGLTDASNLNSAGPGDLMLPVSRSMPYATDENTVQIQFTVDIHEPTTYKVFVLGPLSHLDQARISETTITVLPGVGIGTDPHYPEGIVVEVPGLCISHLSDVYFEGEKLSCTAEVTMMCGCEIKEENIQPPWPWPPKDFVVQMVIYTSGNRYPLNLTFDTSPTSTSSFCGNWNDPVPPNESVESVWLYAYQSKLGNQGCYQIFPNTGLHAQRFTPDILAALRATGVEV